MMIPGEVLTPDAEWAWRYTELVTPPGSLLGYTLTAHYAALDAMAAEAERLELE